MTNPYGQTKLMIEQIMRDVAKADDEWSIALLRYFNPFELIKVAVSEKIQTGFQTI